MISEGRRLAAFLLWNSSSVGLFFYRGQNSQLQSINEML